MMSAGCRDIREDLGAYLDRELSGPVRLQVAQHLEICQACALEAASLTELRDVLQSSVQRQPEAIPPALDGLAGGVISRVRAESAQSWRALFDRAFDDWHWTLVGAGSVASTFLTTTFLSMILAFGPAPKSEDSLAALISNLGSPAGMLFVYAAPSGNNGDSVLLQFGGDSDAPRASSVATALARSSFSQGLSREAELANELADLVTRQGRIIDLSTMHPTDRRRTEDLMDQISRLRFGQTLQMGMPVNVRELRLITSTSVSAKGL